MKNSLFDLLVPLEQRLVQRFVRLSVIVRQHLQIQSELDKSYLGILIFLVTYSLLSDVFLWKLCAMGV